MEDAGDEIPLTTPDNRVVDIVNQGTSRTPARDVSKAAYSTDLSEIARGKAKRFIEANLPVIKGRQQGKLIIYGYSMGGDTAIELANELKGKYVVDLLITVDAATGGNWGVDRTIPSNVRKNINFWTKNPKTKLGQSGGPNHAENQALTRVYNYPRHKESHGSIYKATKGASIEYIRKELGNKDYSHLAVPLDLLFDGHWLIVKNQNDGTEIDKFAAHSGLPARAPHLAELIAGGRKDLNLTTDYRDVRYQDVHDAGPIVAGDYTLKLKPGMAYDKTGGGWGVGGWKLEAGFWNDLGLVFGGRGGFFLHHDGGAPGTAGCIGMLRAEDVIKLRKMLDDAQRAGQEDVEVSVIYVK